MVFHKGRESSLDEVDCFANKSTNNVRIYFKFWIRIEGSLIGWEINLFPLNDIYMVQYYDIGAKIFDGMYDHEGKEIGGNEGIGKYPKVLEWDSVIISSARWLWENLTTMPLMSWPDY